MEEIRPPGQPTLYKPEYCAKVIELGKAGKSITQMACALGCSKQTVYNWMKTHTDFFDAIKDAVSYAQGWWEDKAQENLIDGKLNTTLWQKVVSCRFREDYTDYTPPTDPDKEEKLPDSQIDIVVRKAVKELQEEF